MSKPEEPIKFGQIACKCICGTEPCDEVKDLLDNIKSLASWTDTDAQASPILLRDYLVELLIDWLPAGKGGIR